MGQARYRVSSQLMSLASRALRRIHLVATLCARKALSVFGHKNFVRFIVLTRSRTGSNLLLSYLNGHPNILAEGEIFARLNGKDSLARLRSTFGKQPRRIKAKGFKIFYYHPLDAIGDALWEQIAALEDIKVIHLTRHNVLRTLLSRKIAGTKGAWTGTRFDVVDSASKRVSLNYEELEQGFTQTRKWEDAAETRFRMHPMLQISYEELVRSPHETFSRVLDFLGVPSCDPRTSLRHQNPESLRELIENYDELKRAFTGSPWEEYFVD